MERWFLENEESGALGMVLGAGRRGVTWRLSRRFQVDMVWEGVLVGLAGGGVVTLYRLSLSFAERALRGTIALARTSLIVTVLFAMFLVAACLAVGRLMTWEPFTQGSGIPQTDAEVIGKLDMPWHRVMLAKFAEGTLCAFSGLSLGREGPSVQLGAMGGKAVSRALGRGRGEERLLVTCGAAAGMSAAFNAPLTGVLFALEEIHKEFSAPLIISVMASSIASDFLVSQVLGVKPVLQFVFSRDLPHPLYAYVVLVALFCGAAGAVHNRGMFACTERLYSRITRGVPYSRIAIPFALALPIAFLAPQLMCGGDAILEQIAAPGNLALGTIVLLLVGKYLYTTVSFASGAPGGTLFPLCVMGVLCGLLFGTFANQYLGLPASYVTNFVVLGIAGLFASVVQAPVTAVVLAFELTGSLDAMLSASIVSMVSYVTASLLGVDPFYEHLLSRLLGSTKPTRGTRAGGERELHSYTVGAGSRMEGRTLAEIPWPEGARVVTISRGSTEIVPTGSTKLLALDEVLVIMTAGGESDRAVWNLARGSVTTERTPRSR